MNGIPTPENIFEELSESLEGHYHGEDHWGAKMWEYQLNDDQMVLANHILVEHELEPVEKVYFGRQLESENDEDDSAYSESVEIASVNLQTGKHIQYYGFTRYDDSTEIEAKKDIIIDEDNTDLLNLLNSKASGNNPNRDLLPYAQEMRTIGSQELFALSALIKLVKKH